MKRLGALVLAVLMVAAAFAARGALGGDDGEEATERDESRAAGIVCARDLAAVCAAAGVTLAGEPEAGATADALIAADDPSELGGEAWLVTSAWAAVVADERARNRDEPLFEVSGAPLASSPVVLALWADRAPQLAARCGLAADAAPGWRCLAEQAGTALDGGDRVSAGMPDVDTATGLAVAGAQAVDLLGRTDFGSNDFDGTFRSLADRLAGGQLGDPLQVMRSRGPGQVTAAGTVVAEAANLASSFGSIRPTVAEPAVRADVVLVVPAGAEVSDADRTSLAEALLAAGWDPPSSDPDGLPSGGVLAAIRTLWTQNR